MPPLNDRASFRASFPSIQGAIKFAGDGGMRLTLDVPESDVDAAAALLRWRDRLPWSRSRELCRLSQGVYAEARLLRSEKAAGSRGYSALGAVRRTGANAVLREGIVIVEDMTTLRTLLDKWLDIAAERFTHDRDPYFDGQHDAFGMVLDALDTICPVEVHVETPVATDKQPREYGWWEYNESGIAIGIHWVGDDLDPAVVIKTHKGDVRVPLALLEAVIPLLRAKYKAVMETEMATQPPSNSNPKPGATTVKPEASNQRVKGGGAVTMPVNRSACVVK